MANVLTGRTWVIDSTGVLTTEPVKVKSILVGTSVTIKDNKASPNIVFSATAAGYFPDICEWFVGGLQVTAISGTVTLYLE